MLMIGLSLVGSLVDLIFFEASGINNFLRPLVVISLFQSQRANFRLIFLNIKDSIVALCLIFFFTFYFS
jgi:hypothetical protein